MIEAFKVAALSALCALGLAAASAAPALAQTINYTFSGDLIDGDAYDPLLYNTTVGTVSGTFSVDTQTSTVPTLAFTVVSDSSEVPSGSNSIAGYSNVVPTYQSTCYFCYGNAVGDVIVSGFGIPSVDSSYTFSLDFIFPPSGGSFSTLGFEQSSIQPNFDPNDTDGEFYVVGTVSEAAPVSAAPEPSAWVLMIAGVALAGGMLRYGAGVRRRQAPSAADILTV
jgi:hypothetical protein